MRKNWPFITSFCVALIVAFYAKYDQEKKLMGDSKNFPWKTFVKKSENNITSHYTTAEEFIQAKIPIINKQSTRRAPSGLSPLRSLMMRNDRILLGEIDRKYENSDEYLFISNKFNSAWKDLMGKDLMRFQRPETKIIVKEESSAIKIENGQGKLLEQVIITYLLKDGDLNSFKALVDSENGAIVETWDRTIHEKPRTKKANLGFMPNNENGIVVR